MRRFLPVIAAFLFSACAQPEPTQNLAQISFTSLPPIRLGVAEIRVIEAYEAPLKSPHVEHNFPVSPAEAVKIWASQRLQAAGTTGVMEITIEDASVIEQHLNKTEGVRGFFTDDQSERYDAKLNVTMRLYTGDTAVANAEGDVKIIRSRSVSEKATINERERLFHDMTLGMITQFNQEAETRLRQYFQAFIR
jgi:hypothetical protein